MVILQISQRLFSVSLLVFFLFIGIFCSSATSAPIETDILFVTYDAGETNAFKPVFEILDAQKIPYKILAFGTSATLLKDNPHVLDLEACHVQGMPTSIERTTSLPQKPLSTLTTQCVSPKRIVSSMSARAMADVIKAFDFSDVQSFAYYDNFDDVREKEYVKPFLEAKPKVDFYLVPSSFTKRSFEAYLGSSVSPSRIIIVGQPSLETWKKTYNETDPVLLKKEAHVDTNLPILLFAGGYDSTYPEFFRLFVQGVLKSNTFGLVTLHPKSDGSTERSIIEQEKAEGKILLFGKEGPSTGSLSILANIVLCHKSTVCMQALFMGKPVIYLADKKDFTNQAIQEGIAAQAQTLKELLKDIRSILTRQNSEISLEQMGVPQTSSRIFVDTLLAV